MWKRPLFATVLLSVQIIGAFAQTPPKCSQYTAEAKALIAFARETGVMIGGPRRLSAGHVRIDVSDTQWEFVEYGAKIGLGLAAYCLVAEPDGTGIASIHSSRDGRLIARVLDGQWRDKQ